MRARPQTWWICLVALASTACDPSPAPSTEAPARRDHRADAADAAPRTRPNIVIIVTDDQASSTLAEMPQTQELLVRQGTLFPNFFINDPICCPSRVTILLGQYRHNHRIERSRWGCSFQFYKEGLHRRSFGTMVREAGYRTGYVGKYLNSHQAYVELRGAESRDRDLLEGWDDYHILMDGRYFGVQLHENGALRELPSTRHQTDELAALSTKFIRESADEGRPFFLFVAPGAPHEPHHVAPRHRDAFEDVRAPRVPSFNEADVSGQPGLAGTTRLDIKAVVRIDDRYRGQLRLLAGVDELVSDVVEALIESGELERTYLFFTSDNGLHFGEHRIERGKGTPFEEAVRVPLVVRGPGVGRGRVLPQLTANVDVLPTVLELIGETPDPAIDGRSLVPLFAASSGEVAWRNAILLESRHENRNQGVPAFAALRTSRFKWIEYENGERALYDLENDRHEMTNVYSTGSETAGSLAAWLSSLLHCSGEQCQRVENETLQTARGGESEQTR